MSADQGHAESLANLKTLLAQERLSGDLLARAELLLSRLEKPVRLAVLGLRDSGRSTLSNLLLGQDVIPVGQAMPTVQIAFAEQQSAQLTMPDGETRTVQGLSLGEAAQSGAIYIEYGLPLPSLNKISILEVANGKDAGEQKRALQWAAARTDIALWCSQAFGAAEQELWSVMPESLTDHGFLLVTKADLIGAQGLLDQTLRALEAVTADQFKRVLPIATTQAIAARQPDGGVDRDQLRASGGIALIGEILRDVEAGRQAAVDEADIFLRQIELESPEAFESDVAASDPAAADPARQAESNDSDESDTSTMSAPGRTACQDGVQRIMQAGTELREVADASEMVDQAAETILWLGDHLSDVADADDPALKPMANVAMDAADLVQLIQIEGEDTGAADALSLLVQLKQELEIALAA